LLHFSCHRMSCMRGGSTNGRQCKSGDHGTTTNNNTWNALSRQAHTLTPAQSIGWWSSLEHLKLTTDTHPSG
jgi:hypothetical protein